MSGTQPGGPCLQGREILRCAARKQAAVLQAEPLHDILRQPPLQQALGLSEPIDLLFHRAAAGGFVHW